MVRDRIEEIVRQQLLQDQNNQGNALGFRMAQNTTTPQPDKSRDKLRGMAQTMTHMNINDQSGISLHDGSQGYLASTVNHRTAFNVSYKNWGRF